MARTELHSLALALAGGALTIACSDVVGGTRLVASQAGQAKASPAAKRYWHVSESASFTPSNSTLVGEGVDTVVPNLVPGKTYYVKSQPFAHNAERKIDGLPSNESSFVAARAQAAHLASDPDLSRLPLNGGFETRFDSAAPPDHWNMYSGTWATDVTEVSDSSGISGKRYLDFASTAVAKEVRSDLFIAEAGQMYKLSVWLKEKSTSTPNSRVRLKWLDSSRSEISGNEAIIDGPVFGTAWTKYSVAVFAPSNARWARVDILQKAAETAKGFYVDSAAVELLSLSGVVTWGNSAYPSTAVTHYATPGGGAGATDTNERKISIPADCILSSLYFRARTGSTNVDYVVTLRTNGSDTSITFTVTAGGTTGSESTYIYPVAAGDDLSIKVVATQNGGGGYVAAADVFLALGIWAP